MRIRKRQSVPPATTPLPISCKYQTPPREWPSFMPGSGDKPPAAVCSNMQGNRCLDDDKSRVSPECSSDHAEGMEKENLRHSDVNVKVGSDGDLSGPTEDVITDTGRTKRRKFEHDSCPLFEGPLSMTAAELLVVNELANGVRQRLHAASEHSTSEQVTKIVKPLENSKDALISSIFFVFDTCGENGLSASEVVKCMLEQGLPGLKEGGARHTVQVANVLRSSSSFISLGDKRYLLCSSLDLRTESKKQATTRQSQKSYSSGASDSKDSENEDSVQHVKQRRGNIQPGNVMAEKAQSNTRAAKKLHVEKPKIPQPPALSEERIAGGEAVIVKTTRRRGPSSSQKGKGPTQCKRYDGRGWQCSRLTEPGYSLCVHHQDLINKRAAKLKEQQTLSRLMESQSRKAKSQPSADSKITEVDNGNQKPPSSRDSIPGAPVQKRKMLSLLAIK